MTIDKPSNIDAQFSGKGTNDDPYIWTEQGRTFIDNRTQWFPAKNEYLTVDNIIRSLFMGYPHAKLPASVRALVDAEMDRRHGTKGQKQEAIKKRFQ